jgi:cyclophilin family peptidyl-prolyl cis-trans isomerase
LERLHAELPQDIRLVYRHFPLLTIHDKAALAAQSAEAAGRQGRFWEMHDLLFERQAEWAAEMTLSQFETWLAERAAELGLDIARFKADLVSPELAALVQQAWDGGVKMGLPGTPFLILNGTPYSGPLNYANLSAIVRLMLLEPRQFETCPPQVVDPARQYFATLKTNRGDIVIELFPAQAPTTVNSFVFLARQDWFDNVIFHRVLPGFVAQAGDPTGTGYGGPGYAFDNEIDPTLKFDAPGLVGMANAGPGSNGSQFFITFAPAPRLDGSYTLFGRVVAGMEVAEQLTPRDPAQPGELPAGDVILDVVIEER